jgi:hypothetical protein
VKFFFNFLVILGMKRVKPLVLEQLEERIFLDANQILAIDGASPPDTDLSVENTLEEVAEVSSPKSSDKGT